MTESKGEDVDEEEKEVCKNPRPEDRQGRGKEEA